MNQKEKIKRINILIKLLDNNNINIKQLIKDIKETQQERKAKL